MSSKLAPVWPANTTAQDDGGYRYTASARRETTATLPGNGLRPP
jgi:hypothetical protein